jgi:cytochrome P450
MFGELTKTADLSSAEQENVEFCVNTVEGISKMVQQIMQPTEVILGNLLGIKTSKYGEMASAWEKTFEASEKKYRHFRYRLENDYDSLDQFEKDSYLAQAIERQKEDPDGFITEDHLLEIVKIMLSAAVDTTSSPFGWNLYHIAVNQDVQMKLYDELSSAIESEGGEINERFLKPSTCPYLHAVIRESHRLTPVGPGTLAKENSLADVQIHDTVIPKGSLVMFDNYSIGMDPKIIDNPTCFQPERWLPPAIEARKGTPAEILDHYFFKEPFSHGSRKCPASRVASNEILILISQLVLDWKISAPSNINSWEDMEYSMAGTISPKLPKLEFQTRI